MMVPQTQRPRRSFHVLAAIAVILVAIFAAGCGGDNGSDNGSDSDTSSESSSSDSSEGGGTDDAALDEKVAERADSYDAPPTEKLEAGKKYVVELDTSEGPITIDVDPKAGPIAAANFVFLVKEGFYDGVKFHRVINEFMIQTGDPTGTGMGGPGYELKDDKVEGTYDRGVVAMANSGPNTGGSQFFIVQGGAVQLSPDYVIFGKVSGDESLKTVDAIATTEVDGEAPVEPIRINSAKLVDGA